MVLEKTTPVSHACAVCHYDFFILPSQAENERDFSLSGVFTGERHARMLVEMLSKIIFMNRNSIGIHPNQTTDLFRGTVDDLNKVTDLTEEYLEAEVDNDNYE